MASKASKSQISAKAATEQSSAKPITPHKIRATKKVAAAAPVPELKGKIGAMLSLLRKPEGASIAALMAATGWQAHSVRGALSGAIKKKRGLTVTSSREGETRVYRLGAQ